MASRDLDLTTWTLATFDTTVLVLIVVISAHTNGRLGETLAGLGTIVGVAVFLYVWALFVLAVRWVLSARSLPEASLRSLSLRSVAAGSMAGIAFFLGFVLVVLVPAAATTSIQPAVVVVISIGVSFAGVVGSVVGLVAGVLNVGVYRVAEIAIPMTPAGETPGRQGPR